MRPFIVSGSLLVILSAFGPLSSVAADREIMPAARVFVAPDGDDANPGTEPNPFRTLRAAQDAIRGLLAEGKEGDFEVVLRGGTYRMDEPLRFGLQDSGNPDQRVTWRARENEVATVSGGREIRGWKAGSDGIWRTAIPEVASGEWHFRELFVNGERRPRARHPNAGFNLVDRAGSDRRTYFYFREGDIPPAAGYAGLEVILFHDWSSSRVPVQSLDHESRVLRSVRQFGASLNFFTIDNWETHPRYFLENDPVFLDAPGEWFLDRTTGEIEYIPRPGEELGKTTAVAPVSPGLIEVRGEPGRPVRNLHFKDLRFEHVGWQSPDLGYLGVQATAHDLLNGPWRFIPAAIQFELAENCTIENGRIAHLGTSGVRFGESTRNCRMEGVFLTDVAGNGVMIGEDVARNVQGQPWWQTAPGEVATGNIVRNNLIERCGQLYFGAAGVWVGIARDTLIAQNTIRHLPYTGVSLGWMWNSTPTPAGQNRVEYNHIHHVMQLLSDGGGIYTLGRQPGSVLRGNVIHTVPLNLGRAESNGMFLDEGTTEFLVEGNLIFDTDRSPLRWHRAEENRVRSNVLAVNPGIPFARYNATDPERITYENNTIIESAAWDRKAFAEYFNAAGPHQPYRKALGLDGAGPP